MTEAILDALKKAAMEPAGDRLGDRPASAHRSA